MKKLLLLSFILLSSGLSYSVPNPQYCVGGKWQCNEPGSLTCESGWNCECKEEGYKSARYKDKSYCVPSDLVSVINKIDQNERIETETDNLKNKAKELGYI